jgi:hypothetical protein
MDKTLSKILDLVMLAALAFGVVWVVRNFKTLTGGTTTAGATGGNALDQALATISQYLGLTQQGVPSSGTSNTGAGDTALCAGGQCGGYVGSGQYVGGDTYANFLAALANLKSAIETPATVDLQPTMRGVSYEWALPGGGGVQSEAGKATQVVTF